MNTYEPVTTLLASHNLSERSASWEDGTNIWIQVQSEDGNKRLQLVYSKESSLLDTSRVSCNLESQEEVLSSVSSLDQFMEKIDSLVSLL